MHAVQPAESFGGTRVPQCPASAGAEASTGGGVDASMCGGVDASMIGVEASTTGGVDDASNEVDESSAVVESSPDEVPPESTTSPVDESRPTEGAPESAPGPPSPLELGEHDVVPVTATGA